MAAATLSEVVHAAGSEPGDAIQDIVDAIDTDEQRHEFLRGLSERIVALEHCHGEQQVEHANFELSRWVGGWFVSLRLTHSGQFEAADREASQLVAAGKIGPGASAVDLRARYAVRPR